MTSVFALKAAGKFHLVTYDIELSAMFAIRYSDKDYYRFLIIIVRTTLTIPLTLPVGLAIPM